MPLHITNPILSSQIFIALFVLCLLFSLRRKTTEGLSLSVTQDLKGFAILAIIFAHIGYFLVSDNNFLYPLSILAGVGVNLFLFLSGYGLTISSLTKDFSLITYFRHRLSRLYIPYWLIAIVFLLLDFIILGIFRDWGTTSQIILGFIPRADIFLDFNSPLWYFTFTIFYSLIFPFVFSKKYPWISAIILYLIGLILVFSNLPIIQEVIHLYRVHILAFPLGVLLAGLIFKYNLLAIQAKEILTNTRWKYYTFVGLLLCTIYYTAIHSNVGGYPLFEELTSLITIGALILLFIISKIESRLFFWFGIFSYEIYLFHWPILSRFDIFYRFIPAWLATILYLILFILLGWATNVIVKKIIKS